MLEVKGVTKKFLEKSSIIPSRRTFFTAVDDLSIDIKDGEVFTPVPNGTFLAGITRARHIENMRADGITVHEQVMSFDDFHAADEVFLSGNMMKVTPVTAFDDTQYQIGPVTRRAREMYWDWAASET